MFIIILFLVTGLGQLFLGKLLPLSGYKWFDSYLDLINRVLGIEKVKLDIIKVVIYCVPVFIALIILHALFIIDSAWLQLIMSLLYIAVFWYLVTLDTVMQMLEKAASVGDFSQSQQLLNTPVDQQRTISNYKDAGMAALLSLNVRVFTLLFLYAIFGLWIPTLFVILQLCIAKNTAVSILKPINQVLAWIPARITGFVYCVITNPASAAMSWWKSFNVSLDNEIMLRNCIDNSIGAQNQGNWESDSIEMIVNTARYAVVIWLVFAFILSLFFFN